MKSQIHENRKNKLQNLSKKLLMLIAVVCGTSVMVSAAPITNKTTTPKEVKITKHPKQHKAKSDKKVEKKEATPKVSTPKAK